jgi:hypothetical protein
MNVFGSFMKYRLEKRMIKYGYFNMEANQSQQ